jgi:3-oxoacyl-(acyl-carrier-protein) synthase
LSAAGIAAEDRAEAESVRRVFKNTAKPELVSTKPLTGFLGYASAAAETGLAALSVSASKTVPSRIAGRALSGDEFRFSCGGDLSGRALMVNHFVSGLVNHTFVLKPAEARP